MQSGKLATRRVCPTANRKAGTEHTAFSISDLRSVRSPLANAFGVRLDPFAPRARARLAPNHSTGPRALSAVRFRRRTNDTRQTAAPSVADSTVDGSGTAGTVVPSIRMLSRYA